MKRPREICFQAHGIPAPSGSRRVMPVRLKSGKQTYRLLATKQAEDWVAVVRSAAVQQMNGASPWSVPLRVAMTFIFPRPKKHYRGGCQDKPLRANAPRYVCRRPDLDKLVRAVLDAMTGVVYLDDAQVVDLSASKVYVCGNQQETPSVLIHVSETDRTQ